MGFFRPCQRNSSLKQEKSSANKLTRPAAEPLAACMQLVKLQEYFCRNPLSQHNTEASQGQQKQRLVNRLGNYMLPKVAPVTVSSERRSSH